MSSIVERFAPSPTGYLHLGHAYSALAAHDAAREAGGRFLLRIEDLDRQRSRPDYEDALHEDLRWLGVEWDGPVLRQSERFGAYAAALDQLRERGLIYPCFCTRKEINAALSAPQEGGPGEGGPDGPAYPGTCRNAAEAGKRMAHEDHALRLNMRKAVAALGGAGVVKKLHFKELGQGPEGQKKKVPLDPDFLINACGDIALARKDTPASYHLSVVLDDAHQEVSHVTRGRDLFHATKIHRLLQALFGRPTPLYRHHRLIRDEAGKRLAKRDDARSLRTLRGEGATPEDIREMVGLKS